MHARTAEERQTNDSRHRLDPKTPPLLVTTAPFSLPPPSTAPDSPSAVYHEVDHHSLHEARPSRAQVRPSPPSPTSSADFSPASVAEDYTIRDAILTPLGRRQSLDLHERTKGTFQRTAQLLVSSPVRPPPLRDLDVTADGTAAAEETYANYVGWVQLTHRSAGRTRSSGAADPVTRSQ